MTVCIDILPGWSHFDRCVHINTRTFSHSCKCAHAVWPPADTDTPVVMAWSAERSDVADLTHLTEVLILKILPRDFFVIIISTYKISRCFETCEITRMSKNFSYWSNAKEVCLMTHFWTGFLETKTSSKYLSVFLSCLSRAKDIFKL